MQNIGYKQFFYFIISPIDLLFFNKPFHEAIQPVQGDACNYKSQSTCNFQKPICSNFWIRFSAYFYSCFWVYRWKWQEHKLIKLPLIENADTANALYKALINTQGVTIIRYHDKDSLIDDMEKGKLAGIINIQKNASGNPPYNFTLKSTNSSNDKWPQFKTLVESVINQLSNQFYKDRPTYANFDFDPKRDISEIRQYKTIDFILPGQLGFSLLASGVFGVAFMFFNLSNTLVLKRFFATPISRTYIILGEMLSRVLFQLLTAIVIILIGRFFFGFTLIHGFETFLEYACVEFYWACCVYGIWFYSKRTCKKR